MTKELYNDCIKKIYKAKIQLITDFHGLDNNIQYKCNECKTVYMITAKDLLYGKWCDQCSIKYTKKQAKIFQQINNQLPNIEILGNFIGTRYNVLCHCKKCYTYWISPINSLLKSIYGCPTCRYNNVPLSMTHEEFVNKMVTINPNITIIGQFIGMHKHINYKCNICGLEKKAIAYELIYGQKCNHKPQVKFNNELKSIEQYQKDLLQKYSSIDIVQYNINKYNDLIQCKCNNCNQNFTQSANLVLKYGCPYCFHINNTHSRQKFKSSKEFENKLQQIHGNKFKLLELYISTQDRIHFQCENNHIFIENPMIILKSNYQCHICKKQEFLHNVIITKGKEFKEKLAKFSNNTIIMLEPYTGIENKIKFKCLICDHEWKTMPSNIIHKNQLCPQCALNQRRLSTQDIINILHKSFPDDHILFCDNYKNVNTKGKCFCKKCNNEFYATMDALKLGYGCPQCDFTISRGEKFLCEILSQINIQYKTQYIIEQCKYKSPLRFDFGIINDVKQLLYLIEYDGKQHYSWKACFGKTEQIKKAEFKSIQIRDNIKNQYCKDNNIPLIRLKKWHSNDDIFKKILKQELTENLQKYHLYPYNNSSLL